jgi:hypothetical protein
MNGRAVHVEFVADKVALGQVFIRVLRLYLCQYHSTAAPYSLVYHLGVGHRAR